MRKSKRKLSTVAPMSPARVSSCRLDRSGSPRGKLGPGQSPKRVRVSQGPPSGEKVEQSCVRVAVRVRPFTAQELQLEGNRCAVRLEDGCIVVDSETAEPAEVRFSFDHNFWSFNREDDIPFASQAMVYETLGSPLMDKALEGYNVCLFAYGMTSSGKSYSILGNRTDEGIIPRVGDDIFQRKEAWMSNPNAAEMNLEISFYEVYNEKIRDLFAASHDKSLVRPELRVREHPEHGPYVEGLSSFAVKTPDDVRSWLSLATKFRATAATSLNEQSSRSHAVFVLAVHRSGRGTSRVNVVDLAGCERTKLAGTAGLRQKEGAAINRSLLTLGRIIAILAEHGGEAMQLYREKKIHIPFRDSTLTWLLKESLGGSSQTAMLATISPAASVVEETLNTLRYAAQTRRIVNCARVCEDPKVRVIRELRAEISRLQAAAVSTGAAEEVLRLQNALRSKEEEVEALRRNWQAEAAQAEAVRQAELRQLEKAGLGPTRPASSPPCGPPALVKLHADPMLHETVTYPLREGETLVGSEGAAIRLSGPFIAPRHSLVKFINGCLRIEPIDLEVGTYINGQWLEKEAVLHDNDRLVFGEHYFRVRLSGGLNEAGDFERARSEHLRGREGRGQTVLRATEVTGLRNELRVRESRIRELEDALLREQSEKENCVANVRKLQNDVELLRTPARSAAPSPVRSQEVGVGSSFRESEEGLELQLWVRVTEANQLCRQLAANVHFAVKPNFLAGPSVRVDLQDRLSALWPPELFEAKLQELQELWEARGTPAAVVQLLQDAHDAWEPLPVFPERSLNASASSEGLVTNQSAASFLFDDKESEVEMAVSLINSFQTSAEETINHLTGPAAPGALAAALSHLDALFSSASHLSGSDPLDLPGLLPHLTASSRHLLAASSLLRHFFPSCAPLQLAQRRLANMLPVFCANLRHRLRGLRAFVVEDGGFLDRVLAVVRALAALAKERGEALDAGALKADAVTEAVLPASPESAEHLF